MVTSTILEGALLLTLSRHGQLNSVDLFVLCLISLIWGFYAFVLHLCAFEHNHREAFIFIVLASETGRVFSAPSQLGAGVEIAVIYAGVLIGELLGWRIDSHLSSKDEERAGDDTFKVNGADAAVLPPPSPSVKSHELTVEKRMMQKAQHTAPRLLHRLVATEAVALFCCWLALRQSPEFFALLLFRAPYAAWTVTHEVLTRITADQDLIHLYSTCALLLAAVVSIQVFENGSHNLYLIMYDIVPLGVLLAWLHLAAFPLHLRLAFASVACCLEIRRVFMTVEEIQMELSMSFFMACLIGEFIGHIVTSTWRHDVILLAVEKRVADTMKHTERKVQQAADRTQTSLVSYLFHELRNDTNCLIGIFELVQKRCTGTLSSEVQHLLDGGFRHAHHAAQV